MSDPRGRIAGLSPEQRVYLRSRLLQRGIVADERTIPRREAADRCPLSFAQQRLWFLQQLEPSDTSYNIPQAIRARGALDAGALRRALGAIAARHEALSTTFAVVEGAQPVQVIAPTSSVQLPVEDLAALPGPEREAAALRWVHEEVQQPFDLARGPLLLAKLLRLSEEEHVLVVGMHHIVGDGWSMGVFWRELEMLYDAFVTRKPSPLAELPIQYADFAIWQRQWLQGKVLEKQLSYWKRQLAEVPVLRLPTDHTRPAVQAHRGARQELILPKSLTRELKELSADIAKMLRNLQALLEGIAADPERRISALPLPIKANGGWRTRLEKWVRSSAVRRTWGAGPLHCRARPKGSQPALAKKPWAAW